MKISKFVFIKMMLVAGLATASANAQMSVLSITEDVYSPTGAQFSVSQDSISSDNVRTASAKITGVGTLTIGSEHGGYPRVGLQAGSEVEVSYYFSGEEEKWYWDGIFTAPLKVQNPDTNNIKWLEGSPNEQSQLEVIETYAFTPARGVIGFSPRAQIAFMPENVTDGTALYFAFHQGGGLWTIRKDAKCIVQSGICRGTVGRVEQVALIKELNETCPDIEIENGQFGLAPECRVVCDLGYEFDDGVQACVSPIDEMMMMEVDDLEAELMDEINRGAINNAYEQKVIADEVPEREFRNAPEKTEIEKMAYETDQMLNEMMDELEMETEAVETETEEKVPEEIAEEVAPVLVMEKMKAIPEPQTFVPGKIMNQEKDAPVRKAPTAQLQNNTKTVSFAPRYDKQSVTARDKFTSDKTGFIVDNNGKRRYTPKRKTLAESMAKKSVGKIRTHNSSAPKAKRTFGNAPERGEKKGTTSEMLGYIKAVNSAIAGDPNAAPPTLDEIEDAMKNADNVAADALPHAGPLPFAVMILIGFALLFFSQKRRRRG